MITRTLALMLLLAPGIAPSVHAGDEDESLRDPFPSDDFRLAEVMVPMRDGIELYTLIFTPKNAAGPMPILLFRTPYDASRAIGTKATTRLEVMRGVSYPGDGYILVMQDIRGRFKSKGTYAMYRPPVGSLIAAIPTRPRMLGTRSNGSSRTSPATTARSASGGRPIPAG